MASPAIGAWLFCAHFGLLVARAAGVVAYSKLQAGEKCKDYSIPSVPTWELCIGEAAAAAGLQNVQHVEINGMGFMGCVYNTQAGNLMFGKSSGVTDDNTMVLDNLQYLCQGVPTTTTTNTATTSTVTETTTRAFINKLNAGDRCSDFMAFDVPNEDFCFNQAAAKFGLTGKKQQTVDDIGFTGCVYNNAADVLMYGKTNGVTPQDTMVLPSFEYICAGILQTSTSTTASTSTASTSTVTTTTLGPYALLPGSANCHTKGIHDILDSNECFNQAGPLVGLSGKLTMPLHGIGFSGCVYNSQAGTLMFGVTNSVTPQTTMTLDTWHYVCKRSARRLLVIP